MTAFVLRFMGATDAREEALERLRARVPGIELTPKTRTLVEALVEEPFIPLLQGLSEWDVSSPTYAEIDHPAYDFSHLRGKIGV